MMGNPGQANYAASKAGIVAFTKSAAREVGARGINVNAIAPGLIEGEMTDAMNPQWRQRVIEEIPRGGPERRPTLRRPSSTCAASSPTT